MPAAKWTKESAAKVLAKCHSRREAKQSPETNGAWQWAYKKGLLPELTEHFERERVQRGAWQDIEKCREVLARFLSPAQAKADKEGAVAYRVARESGWIEDLTLHWSRRDTLPSRSWSPEKCMLVLSNYSTLLEAQADPLGRKAIQASRHLDCYPAATAHMLKPERFEHGYWTKDRCKNVLASFNSLGEANRTEEGRKAYSAARGNGWINEVAGHFIPGDAGFDPKKPASTYFLRLTNGNDLIHKVGITNREVLQRVQTLIRRPGTIIEIQGFVKFDVGIKAKLMEEELLFRFAEYSLPEHEAKRFIGNGFTECFSADIWRLSGFAESVDATNVISGEHLGLWGLSSPSKTKWLTDNAIEAAKACGASRSVLRRKHPSAYNVLREAGILDAYCPIISRRTITDEAIITEIQKHPNAKSLRSTPKGESLYITAKNRGLWDTASKGMAPLVRRGISDTEMLAVAKRYDSQTLFRKENKATYSSLYTRGLIEAACAHMSQKKTNWKNQKDKVLDAAMQCESKSEFVRRFPGAAGEARRAGYWQEATAHMKGGNTISDKE